MHILDEVKKWVGELTEVFLLLIALGVVVQILCGPEVPFFGQIVANLTAFLSTLGENGFIGLIALGIIVWLFRRRTIPAQQ
jgi:hypothetical protein